MERAGSAVFAFFRMELPAIIRSLREGGDRNLNGQRLMFIQGLRHKEYSYTWRV